MALKATKKVESNKEERIEELRGEIQDIRTQIVHLENLLKEKRKEILELKIAPFKIGDYVMYECGGKSKKLQKCVLECSDYGDLHARPVKEDGSLSGRHFVVIPARDNTYQDLLQEVKE